MYIIKFMKKFSGDTMSKKEYYVNVDISLTIESEDWENIRGIISNKLKESFPDIILGRLQFQEKK